MHGLSLWKGKAWIEFVGWHFELFSCNKPRNFRLFRELLRFDPRNLGLEVTFWVKLFLLV
jgi:hypothetical protein